MDCGAAKSLYTSPVRFMAQYQTGLKMFPPTQLEN